MYNTHMSLRARLFTSCYKSLTALACLLSPYNKLSLYQYINLTDFANKRHVATKFTLKEVSNEKLNEARMSYIFRVF